MQTLLLFGATGQVGRELLRLALAAPAIAKVVAPTRQALPPHPKLLNPIIADFAQLPEDAAWWSADSLICALGTTLRQAKSKAGFYWVDHTLILNIARCGLQAGIPVFGLVSSIGADPNSRVFYAQVKGQTEAAVSLLGFQSLVIVRPALLLSGPRSARRPLESLGQWLSQYLGPYLPKKYRPVTTQQVAQVLLAALQNASSGIQIIPSEQL